MAEEYIKKEEMVVLCVVPAMSDFGNAEVGPVTIFPPFFPRECHSADKMTFSMFLIVVCSKACNSMQFLSSWHLNTCIYHVCRFVNNQHPVVTVAKYPYLKCVNRLDLAGFEVGEEVRPGWQSHLGCCQQVR